MTNIVTKNKADSSIFGMSVLGTYFEYKGEFYIKHGDAVVVNLRSGTSSHMPYDATINPLMPGESITIEVR